MEFLGTLLIGCYLSSMMIVYLDGSLLYVLFLSTVLAIALLPMTLASDLRVRLFIFQLFHFSMSHSHFLSLCHPLAQRMGSVCLTDKEPCRENSDKNLLAV
jgi:hypothetical protein